MSKTKKKTRWSRVFLAWTLALAAVFLIVPQQRLPESIRDNAYVAAAYDWKNGADQKAASIEPAAGEKGYAADDRRELDSLISRGSYEE